MLLSGDQHLAAQVATLFGRRQLVFVVHPGRAGTNQVLGQFIGVERATKAGFGIGHNRQEVVDVIFAFGVVDLVGASQGVVDALYHFRHRVIGVEGLVGVGLGGGVPVTRYLPAREIDGVEPGLGHLYSLVTGDGAQGVDVVLGVQQVPQFFGAATSQGVFLGQRALQTSYLLAGVGALDALPTGVLGPVLFDFGSTTGDTILGGFGHDSSLLSGHSDRPRVATHL